MIKNIPAAVLTLALTAGLGFSQSGNSSAAGRITEPTGQSIPEANVRISNVETGVQQTTVTNEQGHYRVGALLPGSYRIEVEAPGFDRVSRGPLPLEVWQNRR